MTPTPAALYGVCLWGGLARVESVLRSESELLDEAPRGIKAAGCVPPAWALNLQP